VPQIFLQITCSQSPPRRGSFFAGRNRQKELSEHESPARACSTIGCSMVFNHSNPRKEGGGEELAGGEKKKEKGPIERAIPLGVLHYSFSRIFVRQQGKISDCSANHLVQTESGKGANEGEEGGRSRVPAGGGTIKKEVSGKKPILRARLLNVRYDAARGRGFGGGHRI